MEGNWDTGSMAIASIPNSSMNSDITMANTGRFINMLNMLCHFEVLNYSVSSSR